jgi:hypothetical protein
MRTLALSLIAATLTAALALPADAAPKDRDRTKVYGGKAYGYSSNSPNGQAGPCVVTGWTDWSLTRPIFKCPEDEPSAKNPRRR